jgi:glycine cleavage system H protein
VEKKMIPEKLYYTKDHEWAKIEKDIATVGITDHAQEALGEVTFVELPQAGKKLKQHGTIGSVESSKAASDVYSPVAGTVTEVNERLSSEPELINKDCYSAGWICKVRVSDLAGVKNLMDAKQYEEYLTTI